MGEVSHSGGLSRRASHRVAGHCFFLKQKTLDRVRLAEDMVSTSRFGYEQGNLISHYDRSIFNTTEVLRKLSRSTVTICFLAFAADMALGGSAGVMAGVVGVSSVVYLVCHVMRRLRRKSLRGKVVLITGASGGLGEGKKTRPGQGLGNLQNLEKPVRENGNFGCFLEKSGKKV